MQRVLLPFRGATNALGLRDTPPGFAPVGTLLNFWPHTPGEDRMRGGQRAGLELAIPVRMSVNTIQAMEPIALSSEVTSYVVNGDTCADIATGENRDGGELEGQVWMLSPERAMFRDFYDDRGTGSLGVNACCWNPDGDTAFYAMNFTDGSSQDVVGVTAVDRTGAELWQVTLYDRENDDQAANSPALSLTCNAIATDGTYVFVTAERYVYVVRASDGKHMSRDKVDGWSQEMVGLAVRPDGKLVCCFGGNGVARTLPSGVQVIFGSGDFRSGVCLYSVEADGTLTREQFGPVLSSSDQFYESNHGYFRMSEWMGGRPRGGVPTGIAVGSDNSVYVTRRNKGWGPNKAFMPDDDQPFISVFKLDSTGQLVWEADTESKRAAYTGWWGTFYNDRGETEPSLQAIAVSADGVYVAGDVSTRAGGNVFRLHPLTGARIATINLGDTIREGAMDIAPGSGLVIVGGDRSNSWPDAGGAEAHLWWLSPGDLSIADTYDLAESVSALAVAASAGDEMVYATDFVT